ncbi:MAG: hypothetical protein NT126_00825 [Bacteroidetes bacterium]|nr:hypothetical protein [Bacteroidota bacterium]
MFQKARETSYLESTSILVTVTRWYKPLLIITFLAALCSYIFSGETFIKPKFKSTVILFPAATNSISKSLMDENSSDKQDIMAFGEEEKAEQVLQILNSDEIRDIVVNKYKLMEHYGIESSQRYPMTALIAEFNDNISFQRTEFMSVRIDVMDKDPQMAADIANDISSLLDSIESKIQRQRGMQALQIMEQSYAEKAAIVQLKEDSLKGIRAHGVIDFRNQALTWNDEYAKSYATYSNEVAALEVLEKYRPANDTLIVNTKARIKGAAARMKNLQPKLDMLANYGGASISLSEQLSLDRESMSRQKAQLEKFRVDAMQNLTHKFIVNKAIKAERKSYPVRWLIVLISSLCALFLGIIVMLVIERTRNLNPNT